MKNTSVWECQKCGSQSPKWAGRCPECGAWGSLVEEMTSRDKGPFGSAQGKQGLKAKGRQSRHQTKPQKLSEILKTADTTQQRISTGIGELDRVLGFGMVPGAVMLLAGEPGMGKSTLLSQVALQLSISIQKTQKTQSARKSEKSENQKTGDSDVLTLRSSDFSGSPSFPSVPNILYVCGEESPSQVAMRLRRLSASIALISRVASRAISLSDRPIRTSTQRSSVDATGDQFPRINALAASDRLSLFSETNVDVVISEIEKSCATRVTRDPRGTSLVIIDSIQTMFTNDLSGMAGAVGQIRECAGRLSRIAKAVNIPLFLVGHVTKEGDVAGPKVLEHVVDVVLVMEGQRSGALRMVRAVKNRFGPVDEVGLFAMEEGGMREVKNPAELLIGEHAGNASGSVLGCVLEGQRPLVLEIQALVVPSKIAVPRRVGQGVNERRLQLLCAVIEKHLGLGIGEKDVFVNVAGGLRSQDPGLDLAVVAAIVSSCAGKSRSDIVLSRVASRAISLSDRPIFCGEVGLLGEVRMVQGWERREKEIKRLGLGKLVGKSDIGSIRELREFLQ